MFTRHGHQIHGTTVETRPVGLNTARCGGPRLCAECREDVALATGFSDVQADGKPVDYQLKAKIEVVEWYNRNAARANPITVDNVFVVWFSKTLQNWKCLLATTCLDNMYFEATYNGDKHEMYMDVYTKMDNQAISDRI